jgi:alanine racemase
LHAAEAGLTVEGVWTHLAVADEPDDPFTAAQIGRFDAALARLTSLGVRPPLVHVANSAGALAHPDARRSLVRCGIATYGIRPAPAMAPWCGGLRPALRLTAEVSWVQRVRAGDRVSYGRRWEAPVDTIIATVPIGYADGVPRRLFACGAEVLVGDRRRPLAGVVTMDQLLVDCGPGAAVGRGDEVVLIGRQGDEEITAEEWAQRLGTIAYEITCGIGPRVPRHHLPGPAAGRIEP